MKITVRQFRKLIAEAVQEAMGELDSLEKHGPPPVPSAAYDRLPLVKSPGSGAYKAAIAKMVAKGMSEKDALDTLINLEEGGEIEQSPSGKINADIRELLAAHLGISIADLANPEVAKATKALADAIEVSAGTLVGQEKEPLSRTVKAPFEESRNRRSRR